MSKYLYVFALWLISIPFITWTTHTYTHTHHLLFTIPTCLHHHHRSPAATTAHLSLTWQHHQPPWWRHRPAGPVCRSPWTWPSRCQSGVSWRKAAPLWCRWRQSHSRRPAWSTTPGTGTAGNSGSPMCILRVASPLITVTLSVLHTQKSNVQCRNTSETSDISYLSCCKHALVKVSTILMSVFKILMIV